MGCIHGKCCGSYPQSPDGSESEELGTSSGHGTEILADSSLCIVQVPSHKFSLEYSVFAQRGNQGSYCIKTHIQSNPNAHFFGVFDGHGLIGTQCSKFVQDRLVEILSNDSTLLDNPGQAYNSAFLATNEELHNSNIDDSMSGTTAITVLVVGDMLYVANVGDSRAVLAVKEGNKLVAEDMSYDQRPFRNDECERVKLCGARVLSFDQVQRLKYPGIQISRDQDIEGGDPPKLWVENAMFPGIGLTRSVGDHIAEEIGVIAVPEVSAVHLSSSHPFFVVASARVFMFLSSQTVVDMVTRFPDPRDACSAIAGEAQKRGLEHQTRTDDIIIIIVHIKDLSNIVVSANAESSEEITRCDTMRTEKESSDIFFTPSGSEVGHSERSDLSEQHSYQHLMPIDQSPATVASPIID